MDEMLKLCVSQGYVPANCVMDGMLVYLLINDGQNPCCGCNRECVHKTCGSKVSNIDQNKKDKLERIEKRKKLSTNKEAVVHVESERDRVNVTVIIPNEECGYAAQFKSEEEAGFYIPIICKMYKARQVYVEMNGGGIVVYDCLSRQNEEIKDIDVVPFYVRGMRLETV